MVRPGKRKHEETLDPLTGTHRVSKWGPKYNLSQIGLNIPAYIADGIATSLATSTWSTYKTALNMFRKYKNVSRNSMTIFPISKEDLIRFTIFMFKIRNVAPSTIRQYLTALKCFHAITEHSMENFKSTTLRYLLMGYENQYKAMEQDSQNRRAFTYPLLKLFAEGLANENMLPINAQNYLACATLGFFSSCRMGDLLKDALDTNSERLLTWEKVQFKSNREIIIYLAHPKHAKKENGVVCDVFNFPLPLYCPISNLLLLAKMQRKMGRHNPKNPVFMMADGKTMSMANMNHMLKKLLYTYIDPCLGSISCHSFRAAIPSLMSAHPTVFSEEEITVQGDWHSEAYRHYTRHMGIGRKTTHRKVVATLLGNAI